MEIINSYIPMDRRQAMAEGDGVLPEQMQGAALFADISGFTPLTEALAVELGPRRGAEELTVNINRVYEALVSTLHQYGGSVISFSGDAITCWLRDDDGRRAAACGLAMQAAMEGLAQVRTKSGRTIPLGIKVGIAVGPVRRFVVGDANHHLIDTIAGKTLVYMTQAESVAHRGEVVLHETAAAAIRPFLTITDKRDHTCVVISAINTAVPRTPWPPISTSSILETKIKPWLLHTIYQGLISGKDKFIAELRPAVALFFRFTGLDYDRDKEAPIKLNQFIMQVQYVLSRYEGSLLQLTIGDKGSYFYAAFGAPTAHEDDAARAASAALDLQLVAANYPFLGDIQIGVASGRMRVGAYGSSSRQTYGVIGDNVNVAARLMTAAAAGQILVQDKVREAAGDLFQWQSLAQMHLKGRETAVATFSLLGKRQISKMRLLEPSYRLPMVGRQAELALITEKVRLAAMGKGQVIGISAEAGMGKSRLAAEVISSAVAQGFTGFGGECQSFGTNSSYLVWQGVWRDFLGVDTAESPERQIQQIAFTLQQLNPGFLPRLPLLRPVLNLPIPDNELTASLDAKIKKSALESLLAACLAARARHQPIFIVLEDIHWIDPLSYDLIPVIARAITDLPVFLLLLYRPPDLNRQQLPPVEKMPHFTEISLTEFSAAEAEHLVALKLAAYLGPETAVPPKFLQAITTQAAGNPFYIEELLNYLQDLGIDPRDSSALAEVGFPDSIYSLILSRIDQLNERQQITIRVASVIGRLFPAAMVWGVYPELGESASVRHDLDILSDMELTPLDTPEPELTYLFKHVMTQQVAYESLPFATRAALHNQIGLYIEQTLSDRLDGYLDLLAFHYDRSENTAKRQVYLVRAGEAAQAKYANTAAIDYYERALDILSPESQAGVLLQLGEVLELVGEWDLAHQRYQEAMATADSIQDVLNRARAQIAIGELMRKRGHYTEAATWYAKARAAATAVDYQPLVAKSLICAGTLAAQQGQYDDANHLYNRSLAIRWDLGDSKNAANVLNNMAIVARFQGNYQESRTLHEEALTIRRQLGDRWAIATSLNNLGNVLVDLQDYGTAREQLEEAVTIQREIGDKWYTANALNNLGNVVREQGDSEQAAILYAESLKLNAEMDDKWALAYLLEDVALLTAMKSDGERALRLIGAAQALRAAIKSPRSSVEQEKLNSRLAMITVNLGEERATAVSQQGQTMTLSAAITDALAGVAAITNS